MDYLVGRPEVDTEGIILMGMSMGGFLAPRAAAHEQRLRICIANSGALNAVLGVAGRLSPFLTRGLTDTMWKHGARTPSEMLDKMKAFTNVDGVKEIRATMLVADAEAEEFGQSKELYEALTCEKEYMMFTGVEAAPLHVQTGSLAVSSQRIFDWIDEEMGRNQEASSGRELQPEDSNE